MKTLGKRGNKSRKKEKEGKGGLFWDCKKHVITDNKKSGLKKFVALVLMLKNYRVLTFALFFFDHIGRKIYFNFVMLLEL